VAAGEAELVLTLVSEIVSVPGLQLLGPFPDEVQSYVSFTAGASSGTGDPAAAGALLRFLQSPAVSAAARANGMEIVHP
jgi:molybdate transport system substrate-binding protein